MALLGDGSHVAGLTWPPPAPTGLVAEWDSSGGVQTLVVTYAAPLWSVPSCLSEAEVRVVLALVAGDSQQAIADARGLSRRTVANQIASIYRKLQVHGRLELLVALRGQGRPAARGEKA